MIICTSCDANAKGCNHVSSSKLHRVIQEAICSLLFALCFIFQSIVWFMRVMRGIKDIPLPSFFLPQHVRVYVYILSIYCAVLFK